MYFKRAQGCDVVLLRAAILEQSQRHWLKSAKEIAEIRTKRAKIAHSGIPRRRGNSFDDVGDDDGIDINPPDDEAIESAIAMPALSSMIELDTGQGIFYCTIEQYDDDGSAIMKTQDGEDMNVFLEDHPWKSAHNCDECQEYGHNRVTCDGCGAMRPQGVLDACRDD